MDHSHFLHQQHHHQRTRYATLQPQSHHHNPNHLPPPPLPPPPPPPPPQTLSYRTIRTPPPPPYNNPQPHQSQQFPFNSSTNHHIHAAFSNRILSDDILPRRTLPDFDRRKPETSWNPSPRVVPDDRPLRSYPPVDFDRELHQHQHQHQHHRPPPQSYPPIDNLRYDPEGGTSRLRIERVEAYDGNPRVWDRGGDGNYHRRVLDAEPGGGMGASRESDIDLKSGGYVRVYGVECEDEVATRGGRVESKRWVNDRKGIRELHDSSSFEVGNNEIGAASKREYYGSETARYNYRGNSRDSGHEFTRTPPKKQIQKKSALLRLQTVKPNHRNREIEQLRYPGYAPDSNSNFFRGREHQHGYSGHGMKAEEREGSPVDLDISFESNSLVAKAIVAPSSSAPVSDSNMNPVSDTYLSSAEKSKKVFVSELSTPAVNLNSSPGKASDTSSSVKDLSLQKNVPDVSSQPSTSVTHNPHGKNEVLHSVGNTNSKSSPRVVKKKKIIVKKLVKKAAINPNSTVSNSLSANVVCGTVQADSVIPSSSTASGPDKTKGKSTAVDKVPVADCLHSSPNKGNVLTEDKKGDISLSLGPHSRSQECNTDEDSDIGKVSRFERGGNISNSPSQASSSEYKKSDSYCLDANNSVLDLPSMPNTDKVTESLNGSTFSEINHMDYDNKQLCQIEVSLSPGKYSNLGCPQNSNLVDLGDEMNYRFFSSADSTTNTDLINISNSANDRVYGFNSNDLTSSKEIFIVTDSGNNGTVGKAYSENMASTIPQYAILEENSDTAIPLQSSGMAAYSSSGKTRIQDGLDCLQHASVLKQGSDSGTSNLEDSITVHHYGVMNDAGKQVSPRDVTITPENCYTEETFPKSNISVGSGEGVTNKIKKRTVRTRIKILSSKMEGISPDCVNPVSQANDVDRGSSLLLKDPCPSEVIDQPVQSLYFNSQPSLDGVNALHGKRRFLEAKFHVGNNDSDEANKVSSVSKRKKVTSSHPNFTQSQSEFSDAIVASTSSSEVPISFSDNQAHQKEEVALSSMGILSTAQSMPYSEDIAKLSDNILAVGSFESMDVNRETTSSEHLELQPSDIVSCSLCEDLASPNVQLSLVEGEQKEIITPIVPISNIQTDIMVIGNITGEKNDLQAVEESFQYRDFMQRSPSADMESNDLNVKDDLLALQNLMSCPPDVDGVTTSNSNDELIEDVPDALSDMCSQGMQSEVPDRGILEFTAIHDENICGDEENLDEISMSSDLHTSSIQHPRKVMKSDHAIGCSDPIVRKIMPQPSQVYSKVTAKGLNSHYSELNMSKNQPGGVIPKTFQGHSFTFSKSKTKTSASSTQISIPRTWHRTWNNSPASLPGIKPSVGTVPPKRPILEGKGNFQNTSYVRKGHSLVRKPTQVSALPQISSANQSPSLGLGQIPKSTRSKNRADMTDQPIYLKTEVTNVPLERQRTPPLSVDTKPEENISSPLVEPPSSGCCENASEPRKFVETKDALNHYETPENQSGPSNNGESEVEANDGNISSLNTKRIVYVKPKTNQLVATSNSCDVSVSTDDKGQTAFSDGYYKRSKNQLVRTTFESHINQTVAMPNSNVNSDGQGASKVLCNRRFSKRRSHKVAGSSCKPSRASLVWTLRGKNSSKNDRDSWHYQKVLPHLFPWKRAIYLRSFIHSSASSFNSSSLSSISKKLLLLRKRDTVYTRSTHGFSLWKSKVLGVGGSSLKWSKSIEKHSKQANEEATLAVAAVERKKREQKDAVCISSQAKRERIFRIGSVRYRMDPSRRTLQRISDDESMSSASICSGLAAKRAYIPRRLVIGNDEYVRIGNGNQLIRDPKKRTRKLANEKVRWSLHTARQRLARKQKYCQFFTRFGKCNKDGGKCPYIHDPSKIAVCTKFLNGLCSTPNCKLTHKVIPERMPDCSYFLQGLCSNRNCPYRHVNVNPKASICEGFLKGYCADGNECRKKHSYVCPSFEATGTCTHGTQCKLHHPKKQSKGKKRKRSGDQNSSRGRYFGSIPVDVSEPRMMMALMQIQHNDDLEGELSDYISLDVNEEVADTADQSFEQATLCDNDSLDSQLDNWDDLIKPVLIMKTKFTPQQS
ncbi:uncharacterized protein LOC133314677 [Gastrolobium bilobum]|uniref:uncharacterized protein LOC133314677 n=1 Tax=Gastrolobium bilobum TaxID=150636 RepID=UPI002AB12E1E|nr:uncharacterized protein LOC133314677 [Gastrolobium bilobum]